MSNEMSKRGARGPNPNALTCLPFEGPEKDLAAGVLLPPGVTIESLIIRTKAGILINEQAAKGLNILITDCNSKRLTRSQFKAMHGHDGLKDWVARQCRGKQRPVMYID